jgi:ferric-dicitrate binding protein FerR (iron transport regulator)
MFNTDAAWNKVRSRMHGESAAPRRKNYTWAVAASMALILGIAVVFRLVQPGETAATPVIIASTDKILHDTLPDGSVASLNRNSKLEYSSAFRSATREVKLTGEAFFEVAHDAAHPFIVHTGTMDVKVLGTSFNVYAYPSSDSVRVSVETGKVKCFVGPDTVVIGPGETAVFDKGSRRLRKGTETDPNTQSYRNRILKFESTPLSVAVQRLNEVYGSNIVLKNQALNNCRITVTFRNDSLPKIVDVISLALDLTVSRTDKTITMDGKGCK